MKKIINNKLYNTDTATLLGGYSNGYQSNDFKYMSEELYIKKTGEYFIFGDGGAMSIYSEADGNMRCGSSEIIPISKEEAKEWAMEHLTADKYMAIFGEVEE